MTLTLWLLAGISLLELALTTVTTLWPLRRPLAGGTAIGIALLGGTVMGLRFSLATSVIALISLYRVVNLLRLVQNRTEPHYLKRAVRRSSLSLIALQTAVLLLLALSDKVQPSSNQGWALLAILQCLIAIGLFASTQRQLRKTLPLSVTEHFSDSQLPSLSVCIPARNETEALEDCLRSLVANDYPKLEIIVLDDCSQGPRTSDIIRAFAHDGVRFIQGTPPTDDWLAKNWGYQQLYETSNGAYVLFCGVDTRFEPQTLRTLITTMLAKNKSMASVIPQNVRPTGITNQLALLIQPARYAWELCLPRRTFKRPPVLSSCWVASRKVLEKSGGIAAVRHSITPEAQFAKYATARDGYSFMQSAGTMIVTRLKSRVEQWSTAVRTRYPQLHRRPEMVLIVSLTQLFILIAPLLLAIVGVYQGLWLQAIAAATATVLNAVIYAQVTHLAYRSSKPVDSLLLPFATLLDIYIRHESMWRYEFGEITWKGRNVCLPVMRVIPRLPKI
jgi:hypothetical protein